MENFPLTLFILLIAFLVICILFLVIKLLKQHKPDSGAPPRPAPPRDPDEAETHELSIGVGESQQWEVRKNGQLGPIRVRRGDTIVWKVESTDAFFQFPLADIFHIEQGKERTSDADPWTAEIGPEGGELRLVVSERACPGAYVYSIFCNVAKKGDMPVVGYARGGSPPEFIIMF